MRDEDYLDARPDSALDMTAAEADHLRAEYEETEQAKEQAQAQAKAAHRQRERDEWFRQLAVARNNMARGVTAWQERELADDLAWARTVLVAGETFLSGDTLYATLALSRKAGLGRSLGWSEIARLRRLVIALTPEYVRTPDAECAA